MGIVKPGKNLEIDLMKFPELEWDANEEMRRENEKKEDQSQGSASVASS